MTNSNLPTPSNGDQIAVRQEAAVALYHQGKSYREISDELGYVSERAARRSVLTGIARLAPDREERTAEVRRMVLAEIDGLKDDMYMVKDRYMDLALAELPKDIEPMAAIAWTANRRNDMNLALGAVDRINNMIGQQRAIQGLDAPPAVNLRALVMQAAMKKGMILSDAQVREILGDVRSLAEDVHQGVIPQLGSGHE